MATIPLGLYIWKRIREIGIGGIMGLPGDFNLRLLDHLYDVPGLKWVGNTNELNAAYAADGYARVKGVPGCLVTTHGVGELSALNAIAGACTEQVKLIHVVGQTTRRMQKNKLMIHHSLGFAPDHQVYNRTSIPFRKAAAELQDVKTAPAEIDRVIRECFVQSGPVYIFVPLDMVDEQVPASLLETKIDLSLPVDAEQEERAVKAVVEAIAQCTQPMVFVDALVDRRQARAEAKMLVDALGVPFYSSTIAKGVVDETHPLFVGIYNGRASSPGVREAVEACDLFLVLGNLPADTNTAGFTRAAFVEDKVVEINPNHVVVKGTRFEGVYMKPFLTKLASAVASNASIPQVPKPSLPSPDPATATQSTTDAITQSWVWTRIGAFLRPHDVLLFDTGTAMFGIPDVRFPSQITYITQTYYGSIGFATPAALGADLALREMHEERQGGERGRTVLVTGDGSLMLTIQEVGAMIANGLRPVIIIVNNKGYTIERAIHGANQQYNDIPPFNYRHMLGLFGGKDPEKNYHSASTRAEFESVCDRLNHLFDKDAGSGDLGLQVFEFHMDAHDIPWRLAHQLASRGPEMVKYLKENGFLKESLLN